MKKKNVIGALIMAGAVLVSVPLGVNRSFARLREDVESEYYYDDTGYSIYRGVDTRISWARSLYTLADKYDGKNPGLTPYMDEVKAAADRCENFWLQDVQETGQQVEYNQKLSEAAQALADQLETVELAEKDQKYPQQLLTNLQSEQDKLERSSFNDKVIEYNQKREQFPASVLAPLSGVKEIVPFGVGSGLEESGTEDSK